MSYSFEKLKREIEITRAQTLDDFVYLGEKRGCKPSWAYRAYAARLDRMEASQRDMERIWMRWDAVGKATGHAVRRLEEKKGGAS